MKKYNNPALGTFCHGNCSRVYVKSILFWSDWYWIFNLRVSTIMDWGSSGYLWEKERHII